jgi:hypothetical protein
MNAPTKSVKIPAEEYQLVAEKAAATGRKIQWLIARAIQRVYGKEKP